MKYVNSLKYMNCFETAGSSSEISPKRTAELCDMLGRVNVGNKSIYLPDGALGYAASVMLEAVIRNAGYKVGRITSAFGSDSRAAVYIGGERASIEDYNLAVAEIKATVQRSEDRQYYKEETVFAMALMICKMNSCDYVILQGMSNGECDLASLCAPYDLVIVPTLSDDGGSAMPLGDVIRRGAREVISGTQKKSIYEIISKACFACGARLTLSSRPSFKSEAVSSIDRSFSYGDRSGYTVKSPSSAVAECAMLVIESALAIRRSGVKLPWTSITAGLSSACGMGCFETVSAAPLILLDSSEDKNELLLFLSTLDEIFGFEKLCGMSVCIPKSAEVLLPLLEKYQPSSISVVGGESGLEDRSKVTVSKDMNNAARLIIQNMKKGINTVCFGSVAFESELRSEILKLMS